MANNLFIFAATAVRFIGDEWAAEPQHRLEIILRGQSADGHDYPLSGLDTMYQDILQHALPKGAVNVHARFQAVVGTIIFSSIPFSVSSLVEFLAPRYTASDIRHSLKFLQSVLIVPGDDEKEGLQVYHKSFADFTTDPKRCTLMEAYLPPSTHHPRLCLRHFDMAESMFGTLSLDGKSGGHHKVTGIHIQYATSASLENWLYHLHAIKHQAMQAEKIEEIKLLVPHRIEAFLESIRRYQKYVHGLNSGMAGLDGRIFGLISVGFRYNHIQVSGFSVHNSAPAYWRQSSTYDFIALLRTGC